MSSTLTTDTTSGTGVNPGDFATLQDTVSQLVATVGALTTFQLLNAGALPIPRGAAIDGIGDNTWSVNQPQVQYSPALLAQWIAGSGGASPLTISTTAIPSGTQGSAYTATTLQASGGTTPYSWDLDGTSAALPAGMTLSAAGLLAGTPTVNGTFAMVFRCTDADGTQATAAITLVIASNVAAAAVNLPGNRLPAATVGQNLDVNVASYCTGFAGPLTITYGSPVQLPNHGIDINFANGVATPGHIGNRRALTNADVGTDLPAHFAVSDGATTIQVPATITVQPPPSPSVDLAAWVSTDYNKATGFGHYAQSGHTVVPSDVVNAINQAAANMAAVGGRIYSSVAGVFAVGAVAGASSWGTLINSNAPTWDLDGTTPGTQAVTIVLAPKQPVNAPTTGLQARIFSIHDVAAPTLKLIVDGNAHNQFGDGDTAFNVAAGLNPDGCYYHGVRKVNCGATAGNVSVKNIRGVVGGNTSSGPHGVASTEVFAFQDIQGYGADTLFVSLDTDDGTPVGRTASGSVLHYRKVGSPGVTWIFTLLRNQRHGFGTYCATATSSHVIGVSGTVATNQTTFNLEAGDPTNSGNPAGTGPTGDVTILPVLPASTFNVSGATSTTIIINGNNAHGSQGGNVSIAGMIDTGCADHIQFAGGAWASVTETNVAVISPTNAATHFRSTGATLTAEAATYFLSGCTVHLTVGGSVAVQPGTGLHAGNGTWALV